jgi:5-formyltetrahydrofolate cyclo-ligase
MNKNELRKKYMSQRGQLSTSELEKRSLEIANNLLKLEIWDHTYYHIFMSIPDKSEVNTEYILHILQGKDKSIVVSKSDFQSGAMTHLLLQENTVLKPSKYGIPEPISGIDIPPNLLDVIFVPLLAFDVYGNRVGYGKGFYDRFLANCKPEALFIGLSFYEPEDNIPNEPMDIPLHFCVTPQKIHSF